MMFIHIIAPLITVAGCIASVAAVALSIAESAVDHRPSQRAAAAVHLLAHPLYAAPRWPPRPENPRLPAPGRPGVSGRSISPRR